MARWSARASALIAALPDGNVCGAAVDCGPATPDGGGNPELRSGGAPDGRKLAGCGRMLGGGGGVRAPSNDPSAAVPGRGAPAASAADGAGRERTGGGGGPEGFPKAAGEANGDEGVGGAERTGAGGGPLGAVSGGAGVMLGSVVRGRGAAPSGRGAENDGRGAAAGAAGWVPGGGSPGSGLSLISPLPIAKIDAEKKPGITRETSRTITWSGPLPSSPSP
ncbi:MAG TPA: hypothetical protein VMI54_21465 [Polyangiaceae bacterium]|nr:hypothetical protein [Polyangiaceae bacterium]